MTADLLKNLIELEKGFLGSSVRKSRKSLNALLHDTVVEIGMSGKIYDKNKIIESLLQEKPCVMRATDFNLRMLSDEIAQLIYKLECCDGDNTKRYSIRNSIWKCDNDGWQMIFHQGTVLPESD